MPATFQPFNDLPASQYEMLRKDVEMRGIVNPILVDEHDKTIDGHQRRRVAAELGIECPRIVVEGLSTDDKMSLAIALNTFRRHLTGVERSQALQKMANLGMSQRRIAEATGIPRATVQRDLKAGGPSGPPDNVDPETGEVMTAVSGPAPENSASTNVDTAPRVVGKDGKSYPATKPKAEPSPVAEFLSETDTENAQLRRRVVDALAQNGRLYEFAPEQVAFVLKPEEWVLWRQTARQSREWFDRLLKAKPKSLRIVGGKD